LKGEDRRKSGGRAIGIILAIVVPGDKKMHMSRPEFRSDPRRLFGWLSQFWLITDPVPVCELGLARSAGKKSLLVVGGGLAAICNDIGIFWEIV
jgi:hypothetical protein